ncbi:magnesium transporter CorA family protein [Candidatus Bandiella euplotis]|uniref:Magnesium cobalt transport protein n=1 Tax=Candidatus Bandiella euplotis TaxID=1664265 RepID=A0ABZ0UK33_9RICK|nr:magnesium transporter CorA family protein [Candidatus Bandiella woodruffii]WPX96475.1 Magnesium cobalt transport protein [Candidatus Bandiella woodruffii]
MIVVLFQNKFKENEKREIRLNDPLPENTIWIDLIEHQPEEEKYIERILNIEAPTEEEMGKFEVISPFYMENGVHYMTVTVLDKASEDYPDSIAVTFILTDKHLITARYDKPKSFDYLNSWILRNKTKSFQPEYVLTTTVDFMVSCCADILEEVGNETDALLKVVFEKPIDRKKNSSEFYNDIIRRIGYAGNIISKNRESLVSLNRMIIYFSQIDDAKYMNKKDSRLRIKHLSREIGSLSEYANFLSQRTSFLLDATLGMISVEQNIIIKAFTVAAAVFMPPTLIASVYGMNFKYMPELNFAFGYPLSLLFILISALIPYFYFKRKGWL